MGTPLRHRVVRTRLHTHLPIPQTAPRCPPSANHVTRLPRPPAPSHAHTCSPRTQPRAPLVGKRPEATPHTARLSPLQPSAGSSSCRPDAGAGGGRSPGEGQLAAGPRLALHRQGNPARKQQQPAGRPQGGWASRPLPTGLGQGRGRPATLCPRKLAGASAAGAHCVPRARLPSYTRSPAPFRPHLSPQGHASQHAWQLKPRLGLQWCAGAGREALVFRGLLRRMPRQFWEPEGHLPQRGATEDPPGGLSSAFPEQLPGFTPNFWSPSRQCAAARDSVFTRRGGISLHPSSLLPCASSCALWLGRGQPCPSGPPRVSIPPISYTQDGDPSSASPLSLASE